jgi:hypothetical protein
MNERIKQLAEQAGLRFTQLMSNPMVPAVDGKETDLEKFAELIIQECASLFPLTFTDEQYQRRIDKTILNHFRSE